MQSYRTIRQELEAYGGDLADKLEIVALSKCDTIDDDTFTQKARELGVASGRKPLRLSAVSGQGVKEALYLLAQTITKSEQSRAEEAKPQSQEQAWSPI